MVAATVVGRWQHLGRSGEGDGEGGERSAGSAGEGAGADGGWKLVRGGAATLQRGPTSVVVLRSAGGRVWGEGIVQLLGGRFEALGVGAQSHDGGGGGDEIAAEVDGPNSQFSQRGGLRVGRRQV